MQITAIILAGGKSKRMGTDKALLNFNGDTLLEQAVKLCKPFFNAIFISSNNTGHQTPGCKIIADIYQDQGPLGGIYTGLKYSETEWNFVIGVDTIFVEPAFISYLISEAENFDAVIPVHDNGIEPLIGMYGKSCLNKIEQQLESGNLKMQVLLENLKVNFVDVQKWVDRYPYIFRNLNNWEDFSLD